MIKTKIVPEVVAKLVGDPTVVLKEVTNFKETSGLYEFELNLEMKGQIQKYTSYISKDGKLFFTTGTKVADLGKAAVQGTETKKLTCDDISKVEKPQMTAFVVADCPYGLQMQRLINKAIKEELKLGESITVRYLGSVTDGKITSMHGDKEAQENLTQICIREEQPALYWPYVSCYMQEGKGEDCQKTVGVNASKLTACKTDATKGLEYAKKDFDLALKYNIGSSPTLLVNDTQTVSEFDFGGRTVDALKQIVCCASKDKPSFCSKELSKEEVATSLSKTESAGQAAGAASANCN